MSGSLKTVLATVVSAVVLSGASVGLAAGGGGGGGSPSPSASGPAYDPAAEYQKGVDAISAGKWKDAQRAFGRVTEAAPKVPEGWFMLGFAKAGGGDLKGARKAYEKAVKLKPDDIAARRELGVTLAKLGEVDKARAELTALEARAAACAGACPDAALLTLSIAEIKGALAPAPAAAAPAPLSSLRLAPSPAEGDLAYARATGLINEKRWDEAWVALGEAKRAFGPHPDVLTYQGYVQRRLGRLEVAESYYRQALAIAPDHRGALEYYGELHVVRGDAAGARRLLARLEEACAFGCPEAEELRRWIAAGGEPS
ncbi:MAG TPA: tetratricopeptide repeat protein [Caulobacter sp.]|nr:tetratricopeptide repeat protein [Caulobacter sp.]